MTLLERDNSLSTLGGMLDEVRAGPQGRLVLVGGEAGVGKTALLRSFCESVKPRVRVLWSACEPLRTPRPLGPFLDVAEAIGGELEDLVVAGAARPHEVASALLRELRSTASSVLVIEDVQWADEATLDVITLLAARVAQAPALVLASYRDDGLDRDGQLRVLLGELVRRPGRLRIEPLSQAAVAALAEPHGIDAEELYRTTAGNPFFVIEVLAAGGERIPETVRDAVLARASRLSSGGRRLLEAIAVVPGPAELWLLDTLGGEQLDQVEDCLASGMLSADRAHVSFRHELARLAIEEGISPSRRVALHRQALTVLEARDADPARLAYHAEAAGDAGAVVHWAPRAAARAASSGAHREAAAQYERALRFVPDSELETRAELLQLRADECYVTAQFDAAIGALEQSLACRRALGDRRGEGNALRALSRLLFFAGRAEEGEPLASEAVALLEQLPASHELAMAYANVSQRRMVVEDREAAVAWGTRALELAGRRDDIEAHVYALTNVGAAAFQAGADEGRQEVEQALALAQRHGLEEYAGRAFHQLAYCAIRRRSFELARRPLEDGLEYCSERGLDTWRLYLLASRARLELALGRWDDATDSVALVLNDPRSAPVARGWALGVRALVRARRGDGEVADPLEEAHELVQNTGELMQIAPVAVARAEAAWLAGAPDEVPHSTQHVLSMALERRVDWIAGELAYWRWQAGVRERLPAELLAEPYRLSIGGRATEAAEFWRACGCPYEEALALAEDDDQDAVRASIEQLQKLGARPAAAIVARKLRERGVRRVPRGPRPRTRENPAGLTARELEVLALVAEGLRNAQIAERLVVSEKTVDHHVSAILRKLDVRSRGEAAAEAMRRSLVSHA